MEKKLSHPAGGFPIPRPTLSSGGADPRLYDLHGRHAVVVRASRGENISPFQLAVSGPRSDKTITSARESVSGTSARLPRLGANSASAVETSRLGPESTTFPGGR